MNIRKHFFERTKSVDWTNIGLFVGTFDINRYELLLRIWKENEIIIFFRQNKK